VPEVPPSSPRPLAPNRPFLWKRGQTPSISVGNVAWGGRGKSPVVIHVVRLLLAAGERPAVLSRGYGRRHRVDGVVVVSDGAGHVADLDRAGDEPLMIARAVPDAMVFVCEQRATSAALATEAFGATVLVLDDGFQHRQFARDVDIVLVTPDDLRERGVPFGRLREPVSALRRAHAVVLDGDAAAMIDVERAAPGARRFTLSRRLGAVIPLDPRQPWPAQVRSVVAVAGIASPGRFTESLQKAGWTVAKTLDFPDHHRYRPGDVAKMLDAMRDSAADAIVTTAKDAVRLDAIGPIAAPVGVVPLEATVEPAGEFRGWLLERRP
jgi:tetraacyldisaccharide 4'-kinase